VVPLVAPVLALVRKPRHETDILRGLPPMSVRVATLNELIGITTSSIMISLVSGCRTTEVPLRLRMVAAVLFQGGDDGLDQHEVRAPVRLSSGHFRNSVALTARRANHRFACPALPIKIFRFTFHPNHFYIPRHPGPHKGAFRDRHGRWARDAMDARCAKDESAPLRTAKSCGPDAPTLASSWWKRFR